MILRAQTRRSSSRLAGLAVLGLALLALPWAPSLAQDKQAQPSAREIRQKQIDVLRQLLKTLEDQQAAHKDPAVPVTVQGLYNGFSNGNLVANTVSEKIVPMFQGTPVLITDASESVGPRAGKYDDRIQPGDRVYLHVMDTLPDQPIKGVFRVEATGKIALGPSYGRVVISDLTVEEAEARVRDHLGKVLRKPQLFLTRYDPLSHGGSSAQDLLEAEAKLKKLQDQLNRLSIKGSPQNLVPQNVPADPYSNRPSQNVPLSEPQFEVFRLRNSAAADVAIALDELLNGKKGSLGKRTERVRIVAEPVSNSLLIQATAADSRIIRELLQKALDVTKEGGTPGIPGTAK